MKLPSNETTTNTKSLDMIDRDGHIDACGIGSCKLQYCFESSQAFASDQGSNCRRPVRSSAHTILGPDLGHIFDEINPHMWSPFFQLAYVLFVLR
jgi:hypothetical protein